MKTKRRLLLTGANGLLGQKLLKLLQGDDRYDVIATGRGAMRFDFPGVRYVELDLTNKEKVNQMLDIWKPDVIIHGAAMTHVDQCEQHQSDCYQANVCATENLLLASRSFSPHFIFVSTDFIFSGDEGPLQEEALPDPVNYYGKTKLEGEVLVRQSDLPWSIARTVLVVGIAPGIRRSNLVLWVKESLEQGKTIQVVNDQFRSPTLAEDLASGCLLIAEKKAQGVYNICGPDFLTPYEMALETAAHFGLDQSLIQETDSTQFSQPARRPLRTGLVIQKAQKELGYAPKSFREAIGILAKQLILAGNN